MPQDLLPQTIPAIVERAAREYASLEALVDERDRITFPQLADAAVTVARALISSGVEPGDRVAIWAPNTTEWVQAALGVYAAGAVIVPLNTRFKGAEAAYIIDRARAKLLFTVTDFLDTNYVELLRAAGPVSSLEQIVVLRGARPRAPSTGRASSRGRPDARVRGRGPHRRAHRRLALRHPLHVGHDREARRARCSRTGRASRAYDAWSTVVGFRAGDRYLVVNPFFHAFGLKAGILASLIKGATIVPHAVFDVDQVMRRVVERARVDAARAAHRVPDDPRPSPPRRVRPLVTAPRGHRRGRGPGRDDPAHARRVDVREHRHRLRAHRGHRHRHHVPPRRRPRDHRQHLGRAIPGTEVTVVDDNGAAVPVGEPGEVVVRGYNVMLGFVDDPVATAEAIDPDGWLHTGDIGVMDERGYLRITDRKKDMFIIGGFNAYPAEIENMVSDHPAVSQVAVVGVPDERMGEVGFAFIVLAPGPVGRCRRVHRLVRERMANYKVPRCVEVVDALPLNASGKVLKFELREKAKSELA